GHAERAHRALLRAPRHAPVKRDEDAPPEHRPGLAVGRRGSRGVAPPQLVHRGQAQVELSLLAQPLLELRDARHALTGAGGAVVAAGAGRAARRSARPFWAAIEIGSKSAPIGGE